MLADGIYSLNHLLLALISEQSTILYVFMFQLKKNIYTENKILTNILSFALVSLTIICVYIRLSLPYNNWFDIFTWCVQGTIVSEFLFLLTFCVLISVVYCFFAMIIAKLILKSTHSNFWLHLMNHWDLQKNIAGVSLNFRVDIILWAIYEFVSPEKGPDPKKKFQDNDLYL